MRAAKLCGRFQLLALTAVLMGFPPTNGGFAAESTLFADEQIPRVDWIWPAISPIPKQLSKSQVSSRKPSILVIEPTGTLQSDGSHQDGDATFVTLPPLPAPEMSAREQDSTGRARLEKDSAAVDTASEEGIADVTNRSAKAFYSKKTGPAKPAHVEPPALSEAVVLTAASVTTRVEPQPDYNSELEELTHFKQPAASNCGDYLSDLVNLLPNNSDWLFSNPAAGVAVDNDVANRPHRESKDSEINYLDELSSLAAAAEPNAQDYANTSYRPVRPAQDSIPEAPAPVQSGSPTPYTSIAPGAICETPGDLSLVSRFQPISSISLTGLSTAPPRRHQESSVLKRPQENEACNYLSDFPRTCYIAATAQNFGHPSRNTHRLQHNPLYFEDPNLERCGRSKGCLTSACSSVHFVSTILMAPVLIVNQCPNSCVNALPDCPTCNSFGPEAYFGGCLPVTR